MIALVSDLHISDNSTASSPTAGAFGILFNEIEYTANKADEVHIVLLGDIIDLVRTDYWNRKDIRKEDRPWNGSLNPKTAMNSDEIKIENQFLDILDKILNTNSCKSLIEHLNSLGSQYTRKDGVKIPVKITYVIGNHDRVFNNFPALQNRLKQAIPQIEFVNHLIEPQYSLLARHGYEWDETCYGLEFYNKVLRRRGDPEYERFSEEGYKVMALGEVITAELMSGFIFRLSEELRKSGYIQDEDKIFLEEMKEVNNVKPLFAAFNWLAWFTKRQATKYLEPIRIALDDSISAVIDSELGKKWDDLVPFILFNGDITDYLDALQKILRNTKIDFVAKVADYIMHLFKDTEDDKNDEYIKGAETEWEITAGMNGIQYVIYGHTHHPKYKYFRADPDSSVRMYVNSGTYLPLIETTMDKRGFSESYQLPIIFLYNQNETKKYNMGKLPALDFWNGIRKQEIEHMPYIKPQPETAVPLQV